MSQNVVRRVHFGTLQVDKIDAKIDTQIDAEQISINDSKIIRKRKQNEGGIDELIHLFAKGRYCEDSAPTIVKQYFLRF